MKVDETGFGWISVSGRKYHHDVVVRGDSIEERKKEISSRLRRTHGHTPLTWAEVRSYLGDNPPQAVVIGTGQYGALPVEDLEMLRSRVERVVVGPTPEVIRDFNEMESAGVDVLGIFHVTC